MSFRMIDHTGDLGFEVEGRSAADLFSHAAAALCSLIAEPDGVEERTQRAVHADGADPEEVLISFLGEILYLHEVEDLLFCRAEIRSGPIPAVEAVVHGETFDPDRHTILREIKAVTYHGVSVVETEGTWKARVILDI